MIRALFLLVLIPFSSFSQTGQVGEWVDYSPYHNVFSIAMGNDKVYGATSSGLIEYFISDHSITRFSKVEGLSDIGISCLAFNSNAKSFVVGYVNGKVDIITENEIVSMTDLNRKNLAGNKRLNAIFMEGDYAYIATGFGVIKLDVVRKEFTETYLVESNGDFLYTNDVTIFNDTIYAATVSGVRKAGVNDPQITFYAAWKKDNLLPFPDANYEIVESAGNSVLLSMPSDTGNTDLLYEKFAGSGWNSITTYGGESINGITGYVNAVYISHEGNVSKYNNNWEEVDRIFNYGEGNFVHANTAVLGKDSTLWVGDEELGMVHLPRPFVYDIINPQSPNNAKVDGLSIYENQVWVAAGGRENNFNNVYSNDGVYWRNSDMNWGSITKFKDSGLDGVFDIIDIEINPFDPTIVYGGSLGGGLIEFTNYSVSNVFNATNSGLKNSIGLEWVGVTGIDFDDQGNLWLANSRNPNAIAVYTNEQEWVSYEFGQYLSDDLTGDIIVDQQNYKWVILPHGGNGILVFNDNGTIDDLSDDESKILNGSAGGGGLPSSDVYSIAEDLDGEIWVGTAEGVAVFYSPSSVFAEGVNYDAQQIIVEVNGYFQYLLGTETITAIAVDGANRKWFGTKGSGVFLMSADGTEELHHFTAENSPLLSNFIRVIKINSETGEVLIGTDDGIIAYKGTATGTETLTKDSYAYPNPVPEDYYGPIAVKGLPENSQVTITDIAGNLVFQTISEGTQAVWDGNDMNGQRVGTGIYLVFGIDETGKNSQVAKILFTK